MYLLSSLPTVKRSSRSRFFQKYEVGILRFKPATSSLESPENVANSSVILSRSVVLSEAPLTNAGISLFRVKSSDCCRTSANERLCKVAGNFLW